MRNLIVCYYDTEGREHIVYLEKGIKTDSGGAYLRSIFPAYYWKYNGGNIDEVDGISFKVDLVFGAVYSGCLIATVWTEGQVY